MRLALVASLGCLFAVVASCGDDGVSRAVGARCETARDCDERCLVPSGDYPGGFCTVSCQSSDECPGDADCVDTEGGICLFSCVDDAACAFLGPGWTCRERDLRADPDTKVKVCRGD